MGRALSAAGISDPALIGGEQGEQAPLAAIKGRRGECGVMQVFTVTKNRDLLTHFELADNVRRFLHATQLIFIVPRALVSELTGAYASRPFCRIIDRERNTGAFTQRN